MNTQESKSIDSRLRRVLGGGDTRTATAYRPFPLALDRGSGCRLWDVDGNEFIDLLNNYTSLVHGHAHPAIVAAVGAQLSRGTAFPAPSLLQAELAERICGRIASIERVRFTNSGTEAVMMGIRAARAFTGRDLVVKAHGGYHGSWDQVATESDIHTVGEKRRSPAAQRWANTGIPSSVQSLVRMVPYNDPAAVGALMSEIGDEVAAIVLEPAIGEAGISATPEFLRAAREASSRSGALLVLDEVVTARLAHGGFQSGFDCQPDLTILGKIIGGGLPVGAFGGRAEVMDIFDPRRADSVPHHGTFNGNPLTMAAGCVSLDLLTPAEIQRINDLGSSIGAALQQLCLAADLPIVVRTVGSLIHLSDAPADVLEAMHRAGLEHGLYFAPRGLLNTSTAMDADVAQSVVERLGLTVEAAAASRARGDLLETL